MILRILVQVKKLKIYLKRKINNLSSITDKLKELNITIPDAPEPVGAYVAYKKIKNLLFIDLFWNM